MNLDFMPSPSPEHPGLFIRDPYKFTDAMLVIPPPLVECLQCFDGAQTRSRSARGAGARSPANSKWGSWSST